jgi:peptidoglycan/LPS O-acetylase OafA/YrhL
MPNSRAGPGSARRLPAIHWKALSIADAQARVLTPRTTPANPMSPNPCLTGGRPPGNSGTYIPVLDGVRGLAILAVLAFHLNEHVQYQLLHNRVAEDAVTRSVLAISDYGWIGVDLFFVLSGFLITGILVDSRQSLNYYRAFYSRRTLRIVPLYFGFLTISLLVVPAIVRLNTDGFASAIHNQWYLWTYWSNVGMAFSDLRFGPFSHFWSLAVEEHFYLLWPFVVRTSPPNRLVSICWLCIVVAFATRLGFLLANLPAAAHLLMPCRLDEFAVGGLTAIAARFAMDDRRKQVMGRALFGGSVGLAVMFICLFVFGGVLSRAIAIALRYTLFATASAGLIWLAATSQRSNPIVYLLGSRPLCAVGKYSYGLYVLHVPMIPLLHMLQHRLFLTIHWSPASHLGSMIVFDAVGSICSIAGAMASWHLFEKHFLRLKKRFGYTNPTTPRDGKASFDALKVPPEEVRADVPREQLEADITS